MDSWLVDVPVLLIFFVRDDTFKKVFDSVRQARPSTLLLWQDGPRANRPDDIEGIKKCRAIAENIDWDCKVYKNYHDKNMGCDPSTFYADKWAFSIVDKCIILEDDQVPSQSFYLYCKELLDKYEFDTRISHINGHNFIKGFEDYPYDYLFSYAGTGAWATWKRVADTWDEDYSFLENEECIDNVVKLYGKKRALKWISYAKRHKESNIAHWESIIGMGAHVNSRYAIIPKVNLVRNCGVGENATHSAVSDFRLIPKRVRTFYQPFHEIDFPLKHPEYVLPCFDYIEKNDKVQKTSIWLRIRDRIEISFNVLKYYGLKSFFKFLFKGKW